MTGVDDMSTQDVFGYFKEYPPAHIEWINDTACESRTRSEPGMFGSELQKCKFLTFESLFSLANGGYQQMVQFRALALASAKCHIGIAF